VSVTVICGSLGALRMTCAGLHHLAGAGADRGHHARSVGLEFGEADQIVRGLELGFRGIDLRLRGLHLLFGLVVVRACRPTLIEQRVLALEVISRLRQLALGCRQGGLCGAQRIQLVLRLEPRHHLSRLDPVAKFSVIDEQTAADPECDRNLVFCFDPAGQHDRRARLAFLDRDGADRTRLGRRAGDLLPT
jgi:hypothetical protein